MMARLQISLKARALRYLSAREHSRIELARKLSKYAEETDDIEGLLDALERANLLSQARFCESLARRRSARFGNSRIFAELQSHGIQGDAIQELKQTLSGDEVARACDVWQKKFGRKAVDANERAKQIRFLLQRGFSQKAVQVAMSGVDGEVD